MRYYHIPVWMSKKRQAITNVAKDMGQVEISFIAFGDVK